MATNRTRLERLEQARNENAIDDEEEPRVAGKTRLVCCIEHAEFYRRKLANRSLSPEQRERIESLISQYDALAERYRVHGDGPESPAAMQYRREIMPESTP